MKNFKKLLIPFLLFVLLMLSSGCTKKEAADDYLGRLITRAKETDGELTPVLEDGISESASEIEVIEFPEELKEPYEAFLKTALNQVQFELNKAEKTEKDIYSVRVTYQPIDIEATVSAHNLEYAKSLTSGDLTETMTDLLKEDTELIESNAVLQQKKSTLVTVKKTGDKFSVAEEDRVALFKDVLQGYMTPYTDTAAIFEMRDFIQAYLDASFKGITEQFQKHSDLSPEEAAAWYEDGFSEFHMDELNEEQNEHLKNDLKEIFKQSKYSIGAMSKNSLTEYVFDITVTPNTSVQNAMNEFTSGTYYSEAEAVNTLLSIFDKYAASPTYGEETTMTVTWNSLSILDGAADDPEMTKLIDTILPSE